MVEIHYVCSGTCAVVLSEGEGKRIKVCGTKGCTKIGHAFVQKYYCKNHQVYITEDELKQHQKE